MYRLHVILSAVQRCCWCLTINPQQQPSVCLWFCMVQLSHAGTANLWPEENGTFVSILTSL